MNKKHQRIQARLKSIQKASMLVFMLLTISLDSFASSNHCENVFVQKSKNSLILFKAPEEHLLGASINSKRIENADSIVDKHFVNDLNSKEKLFYALEEVTSALGISKLETERIVLALVEFGAVGGKPHEKVFQNHLLQLALKERIIPMEHHSANFFLHKNRVQFVLDKYLYTFKSSEERNQKENVFLEGVSNFSDFKNLKNNYPWASDLKNKTQYIKSHGISNLKNQEQVSKFEYLMEVLDKEETYVILRLLRKGTLHEMANTFLASSYGKTSNFVSRFIGRTSILYLFPLFLTNSDSLTNFFHHGPNAFQPKKILNLFKAARSKSQLKQLVFNSETTTRKALTVDSNSLAPENKTNYDFSANSYKHLSLGLRVRLNELQADAQFIDSNLSLADFLDFQENSILTNKMAFDTLEQQILQVKSMNETLKNLNLNNIYENSKDTLSQLRQIETYLAQIKYHVSEVQQDMNYILNVLTEQRAQVHSMIDKLSKLTVTENQEEHDLQKNSLLELERILSGKIHLLWSEASQETKKTNQLFHESKVKLL